MKDRIINRSFIVVLLLTCIVQFAMFSNANTLSNELLAWGFRRGENHCQATLDTQSQLVIQDYDGISMGSKDSNKVYLTFDCGYEAGYTEAILDVLAETNVKATFFITAHYVNTQPDLVKKMLDDGHIVGNHTVNHKSMPDLSNEQIKEEVMNLHKSVYEKFGYEMKYIRPPKGEYSERTIEYTNTLGYKTVMWSFAYDDWDEKKQGREEYAKDKILKNIHNGAVMLLHGNSKDNVNVLDYCIKEIKKMGYEFKTLDEFIR